MRENIKKLIEQAAERIIIMPGSGVRADNIQQLAEMTGAIEFHSSARKNIESKMTVTNSFMNENLQTVSIDENEIKAMVEKCKNI